MATQLDRLQEYLAHSYRVERELKGGAMSRVYLAREVALDRLVVIKVLPPELTGHFSLERFKREVSLAARLQHAHIVPVLAAGEAGDMPWYAMPFVEGETLRSRLRRGAMPLADVIRTLRDVASALAYAHNQGIVHRDIKPENVLLSNGAALVTDFGVAKAIIEANTGDVLHADISSAGVPLGTLRYMSPEQSQGDTSTDHRADIYALGLIAYEMLVGAHPFARPSAVESAAAKLTVVPARAAELRQDTPEGLDVLIARCLDRQPAKRPQRATDIVDLLDSLLSPDAARAAPPATRRLRALLARVAALIATVAIVLLAWMGPHELSPRETRAARVTRAFASAAPNIQQRASNPATPVAPHVSTVSVHAPAAPARTGQSRVAVLPFENLTGAPDLSLVSEIASEEILSAVLGAGQLIVDRPTVKLDARETATSAELLSRLRAKRGVTTVVKGSFTLRGDSLRMRADILDAASGRVLFSLEPEVGPRADPLVAIAKLRERLLGGLVSESVARNVTVALRPPRLAAYHQMLRAEAIAGCDAKRPVLEAAIHEDSAYVEPYIQLLDCLANRDSASWETYAQLVHRLDRMREHMSSLDRVRLDYAAAVLDGAPEPVIRAAQRVYETTHSPAWAFTTGQLALHRFRPRMAVKYLLLSDSSSFADGFYGQFVTIALAYHCLGDHRAELAALDRGRHARPNADWTGPYLHAYVGLGDRERLLRLVDSSLRGRNTYDEVRVPNGDLVRATADLRRHGLHDLSDEVTDRAIAKLREVAGANPSQSWEQAITFHFMNRRQYDSARVHHARAAQADRMRSGQLPYVARMAIWNARWGDTIRARHVADSIWTADHKWNRGAKEYWRAGILAALGDREQALKLLTESYQQGYSQVGWHYAEALTGLFGYPGFDALVQPDMVMRTAVRRRATR